MAKNTICLSCGSELFSIQGSLVCKLSSCRFNITLWEKRNAIRVGARLSDNRADIS